MWCTSVRSRLAAGRSRPAVLRAPLESPRGSPAAPGRGDHRRDAATGRCPGGRDRRTAGLSQGIPRGSSPDSRGEPANVMGGEVSTSSSTRSVGSAPE